MGHLGHVIVQNCQPSLYPTLLSSPLPLQRIALTTLYAIGFASLTCPPVSVCQPSRSTDVVAVGWLGGSVGSSNTARATFNHHGKGRLSRSGLSAALADFRWEINGFQVAQHICHKLLRPIANRVYTCNLGLASTSSSGRYLCNSKPGIEVYTPTLRDFPVHL